MMMNSTLETIHQRRSVRVYDPTPLSAAEKDTILQACMRAPTAGAMMLYSIIEVESQELKDKLAITCDNQPFIASAPYVLLFLADYQRWMDCYTAAGCEQRARELGVEPRLPGEGDLMLAMMDALIAAQTAVIAAQSLGIGSCYIGDILEKWETHQAMFDWPQYTFPAALICFGRSAEKKIRDLIPRFDQQFIVFKDRYKRFEPAELNSLHSPHGINSFAAREYPNGARNVVQYNYLRKFTADFSVEMTRSTRELIARWCGGENPSP